MRHSVLLLAFTVACGSAAPSTDGGISIPVADTGNPSDGGPDAGPDAGISADAGQPTPDAGPSADAGIDAGPITADLDGGCFLTDVGVYGQCLSTSACDADAGLLATPGYCPGPADIQCCTLAPNVANNPPVPAGWTLMQQSAVTPAMTSWAVMILDAPTQYPMFSTTTQLFGALEVLARVEWHPPDFQNSAVHRGVTLYVPAA
jgi:hypothetical protein